MEQPLTPFTRLARITRIDRAFDGLIDLILAQYREALSRKLVDPMGTSEIERRCVIARAHLEPHRANYLAIVEAEWTARLPPQELAQLAEVLDQPIVARYFSVSEEIEPGMRPAFERLAQSMFHSVQASATVPSTT